jgi:hypothetical protein
MRVAPSWQRRTSKPQTFTPSTRLRLGAPPDRPSRSFSPSCGPDLEHLTARRTGANCPGLLIDAESTRLRILNLCGSSAQECNRHAHWDFPALRSAPVSCRSNVKDIERLAPPTSPMIRLPHHRECFRLPSLGHLRLLKSIPACRIWASRWHPFGDKSKDLADHALNSSPE